MRRKDPSGGQPPHGSRSEKTIRGVFKSSGNKRIVMGGGGGEKGFGTRSLSNAVRIRGTGITWEKTGKG